jgi:hypothetical protein
LSNADQNLIAGERTMATARWSVVSNVAYTAARDRSCAYFLIFGLPHDAAGDTWSHRGRTEIGFPSDGYSRGADGTILD